MRLLSLSFSMVLASAFSASAGVEDFRFQVETLAEGMPQPMQIKIAPDGRIFFNEYLGKLRILHPETKEITLAGTIKVFTSQENGFLGFALDPNFAANQFIYFLYSPEKYSGQRLSRFKMNGDTLDLASEKVILEYPEQRDQCCHHAGSLQFGPDGCLFIATGDNTNPFADSEGYAPIDERPGREAWDDSRAAGNTNSLSGKILRIRIKPDGSHEIPEGNLFPPGTPKTRPEIYVMGCRNPWRISVDQKTGTLYWGEVGPDANENGPRGPRGYDELNQAKKAGFYGWPFFVGANFPYARYNFETKKPGEKFDPLKPVNESRNNTGLRELPPAQPALIYWPYKDSPEFPMLGKGGRTACAGPVFHYRPEFEKTNGFPQEYDSSLLFWDWQRPFIKWARLGQDASLSGIEDFTKAVIALNEKDDASKAGDALIIRRPVDAVFGQDGCLYLMDYGLTWGPNPDAKLLKISYLRGNLPPAAKAKGTNTAGREPLTVALDAEGSRDPEGEPVTYEWRLGEKVLATGPKASVTLSELGAFRIDLRVTDPKGATGTAAVAVNVGNTPPVVSFSSPQEGDFFTPGKPVEFQVAAKDAEDGEASAKPDEFGFRTLVSANWRTYGGKEGESEPGFARMKQSDCFNCHAVEQQIVGPPLVKIAEKYRGQAGALEASVKRVIAGSTGVWGQVAMLPHPQHTEDEVAMMVRWIYSLDPKKGTPGLVRGLKGSITAPTDKNISRGVIEATYTDAGRPPAASLSAKTTVTLRSRRIEADQNDGMTGPTKLGSKGCTNQYCLGAIAHGHTVRFAHVNLAGVGGIRIRAASGNVGGKIEVHAGDKDGPLLASFDVPNTGGWEKWIEKEEKLGADAPKTRGDVTVLFANPGKSGLLNFDWIEFLPR